MTHAFNEGSLLESFFRNTAAIEYLYRDFRARHEPGCTLTPAEDAEVRVDVTLTWHSRVVLL
jgi:hypothetical protein